MVDDIDRRLANPEPFPPQPPQPGDARSPLERHLDRMRSSVSSQIDRIRQVRGDEQAVYMLLEWNATAVPDYRRRP